MAYDPTPEQRLILAHQPDRHGRVLAGPGTGKSATVVDLIHGLLSSDDGAQPRVRLLTFTRAATAELAGKVAAQEAEVERPSTVHSFAISVLLQNPGDRIDESLASYQVVWQEMSVDDVEMLREHLLHRVDASDPPRQPVQLREDGARHDVQRANRTLCVPKQLELIRQQAIGGRWKAGSRPRVGIPPMARHDQQNTVPRSQVPLVGWRL